MAHEISYNNFQISLVVFMPNITTNHAITYTYMAFKSNTWKITLNPNNHNVGILLASSEVCVV